MREKYLHIKNFIKRITSNEEIVGRIYLYWGILTLVLFGIFGMYPTVRIFISNFNLLNEMYETNLKMESKIQELKEAQEKIDLVGDDVLILERYLPGDFEPHTHMVEISFLASDAGFLLNKIFFGVKQENSINITLSFSGNGNIKKLIENIESSGRIMEIQNIKISKGVMDNSISMELVAFILERK